MSLNTWYTIGGSKPDLSLSPTNQGDDVDPDPARVAPYDGTTGFGAVWGAWNSAAYASNLGSAGSQLHYGGGHRDYYGNGIVRFDLESRTWSMLTQPSEAGPFSSGADVLNGYTDGTPSPPHTYNHLVYLNNHLICMKAISKINAPDIGSASVPMPWAYNTVAQVWRRGARASGIGADTQGFSCVDTLRNGVWMCDKDNGDFGFYEPFTDNGDGTFGSWTVYASSGTYSSGSEMVHDPVEDKLFILGNSKLYRKDPTDMTGDRVAVSMSNTPPLNTASMLQYSPVLGGLVYQRNGTGHVYLATTSDGWDSCSWSAITTNEQGKDFSTSSGTAGLYQKCQLCNFGSIELLVFTARSATDALALRLA